MIKTLHLYKVNLLALALYKISQFDSCNAQVNNCGIHKKNIHKKK